MSTRLLKCEDVCKKASVSVSFIYSKMKENGFPKPVKIGARAVRWRESDVDKWISERGQQQGFGGN